VTTISADGTPQSVLAAIQLLWVNLIMDTLAALALASDSPSDSLLHRKPSKRTDPIINADMFRMIILQAVYQIVVCLVLYFKGPTWFAYYYNYQEPPPSDSGVDLFTATVVFNTFIFCQLFNEINARSISRGNF
jgi:Ca2+-transporting ATPase